jgi:Family of unknown function (DUF6445)
VKLHHDLTITATTFGTERAPLLVVDNFVADADELLRCAAMEKFSRQSPYFPGIRASAPHSYRELMSAELTPDIAEHFELQGSALEFSLCHFSLVTSAASELMLPQRIPHVDSLPRSGLASIHYLFRRDLGGTAFYRHRKTGFEYVDESRNQAYLASLRADIVRPESAGPGYINGDTDLFEQIASQDGVFNRLLIYRRNSLHSGCIAHNFVPDPDPYHGRLSINSFIDLVH